ncbi:MAG: preprotein translocase subunit SecY [Candidatus Micrarchaeota archaeon]|nr:preprotein translocase subunit SecY [Candidatus Micrarchaeota archaeon]
MSNAIIDILHKAAGVLPEIKNPERPPSTKERLVWTGIAVVIFFIMYHVTAFGVQPTSGAVDFLQTITASRIGSLLTAGIGPLVLASIFLQLFVGAGIIKLDMQNKEDKQKFHEVQKILGIILAFVEAIIFVFPGKVQLIPDLGALTPFIPFIVVLQIAIGSIIVLYLDSIVSKYGIGSGISLFIAAGVSLAIVGGALNIFADVINIVTNPAIGGGAEAIPKALLRMLPLIFTILVFIICVYAEGIKVEIPIAFEKVRGFSPKLPLKFFYVSNIPVIFASALILNMQLFAGGILVGKGWDSIAVVSPDGRLIDGFLYFLTPFFPGQGSEIHFSYLTQLTPLTGIPEWVHAITYILFLSTVSILFGMFWVETANMDAKSVANQLSSSGLQIPGFRRDPRMLETILNKYIFPLTVLGSFSVGLLAGMADLTGALGTGTGILLTVGILYKMYEQMEQMNMFDAYPALGKLV